jgi:hypothetical protein
MADKTLIAAAGLAVVLASNAPFAQTRATALPRTPDGHPDLQGVWDFRSATPLERPARFAGREFMTPDEVAEYEKLALEREDGRPPDDARSLEEQSVHPVWWLDYGKKVVKTARTSLIVDPPDGRMPPQTPEARERAAARRAAARTHGPADSYENRSLQERCITRGLPEVTLPGPYNNNLQIVQTRDYVEIANEMIHDVRIVPLDGRPHLPPAIRRWQGDPRGRWEGDTLVVETTNFGDRPGFRGSDAQLRLVERFRRIDAKTLDYQFTVDDPSVFSRPWTVSLPMTASDGPIYEYACHEANYAMTGILRGARAQDKEREK